MASSIAAMLILGLLLTTITLMGRTILVSSDVMERASTAAIDRAASRAKTNFSIESITVFGTTVTIKLKNTGSTSATDYAHMDFIADYIGGGSTIITRLTYTEGALLADQWKKSSISPDNLEENVWNKTETLTLDGRLSSSPDTSTTATFAVGTPDGVTRTISVIVADPVNDILELDQGKAPGILLVSGDIYAVPYTGAGDDGFLKTVEISSSGEIRDEELDTLEYDTTKGKTPDIIPISGDVYAIAYAGDGDDGWLVTVTIATDGQIAGTVIDSLEFDTKKGKDPSIIAISGDVYAIAYAGDRDDGFLATVTIATDGQIANSVIDSLEFDTQQGKIPNIIAISGDVYAIAYGGRNDDGFIKTVTIATDGQITNSVIDTLEFDTSNGEEPVILPISGDVYAIAYRGPDDDGVLKTVTIATDGQITNTVIDTFEYDAVSGKDPSIISIADDVYAIAYEGTGSDGFLVTVTIATDGQITDPVIDTFEFDTSTGKTPIIMPVAGVYVIAYEGPGTDVFLQTMQILTDGQIP
jgi:predicted heme/steroid binding protein